MKKIAAAVIMVFGIMLLSFVSSPYTSSGPITYSGINGITINGKSIVGTTGPCITLTNCANVTITDCRLSNASKTFAMNMLGIKLQGCSNVTVNGCFFTNLSSGVYALSCTGGIRILANQFLNMQGPLPRGQFVQFDKCSGAANAINWNICENVMGKSYPEDAISLYRSSGTASSPILINNNEISGGGPSTSGGGIMLGDGGGNYLSASGNILVNPGQYGMAITGGSHNSIINNTIYGAKQSFTNVGIYVADYSATITNATVSGNQVLYYNKANDLNCFWLESGISAPAGWSSNICGATLSPAILPSPLITMK